MIKALFNWRVFLLLFAIIIVCGSLYYVGYLSKELDEAEKERVESWVAAQQSLLTDTSQADLSLAIKISTTNAQIPIIETDEFGNPSGIYKNLDSVAIDNDSNYLKNKVLEFKRQHEPIVITLKSNPPVRNFYYYGKSRIQQELMYFPIIQLTVIGIFLVLVFLIQKSIYKGEQDRLWVGMAKETAHQLGTPLSSIEGWVELLKADDKTLSIGNEMERDLKRLLVVTDRFGKIGSLPKLEVLDLKPMLYDVVDYMRKRASGQISIITNIENQELAANISRALFEWVLENLLKNALDAMSGKGNIWVSAKREQSKIIIDIKDSGKGMPASMFKTVFKPGFTTKKRGWGLGLALTKRIIEQYHHGFISVLQSEVGKGTTFRIVIAAVPSV